MNDICRFCAPRQGLGIRHLQMFLLFAVLFICYSTRVVLSVAIVAMTDETINPSQSTYDWNDSSVILSSFYWGYIIFQIPSGYTAEKYGIKWMLLICMTINTGFFLLIPFLASYGSWVVILCRILQGLSQGAVFPCTYRMLGKWAPPRERTSLTSLVVAGCSCGTVISMPVAGWFSASSLGWPFAFYLFGFVGVVWIGLWFFFGSDSPRVDSRISQKELKYIEESLGTSNSAQKYPVPYRRILTSVPFWSIACIMTMGGWGYTIFLTNLPTYMNNILNFDIESNSLLSATPYLIAGISAPLIGIVVDWIINRRILSVEFSRKLANSIGAFITSACLISLAALKLDSNSAALAVTLAIVSQCGDAFSTSGHLPNLVDLSPNFAATTMSIANTTGVLGSIFGPLIVQFIVTDDNDENQWSIVFYLSAALELLGIFVYVVFGSCDRQSWDEVSDTGTSKTTNTDN